MRFGSGGGAAFICGWADERLESSDLAGFGPSKRALWADLLADRAPPSGSPFPNGRVGSCPTFSVKQKKKTKPNQSIVIVMVLAQSPPSPPVRPRDRPRQPLEDLLAAAQPTRCASSVAGSQPSSG